jgi:pyridoxal phosphate enzyme (YggS family)
MNLADRRQELLARIAAAARRAGRGAESVRLLAVSKTVDAARVREAWDAGHRLFGENRAQELRNKRSLLGDLDIEWHFIGHLQTNKVRYVVPGCQLIHSVDRLAVAERIAARAQEEHPQDVLVQVNTSGEESKSGISEAELPTLLDELSGLPALRVMGLMTIGPWQATAEENQRCFASLRTWLERERARQRPGAPMTELSMGMSGDFELAIAEGATIVRIGTEFFGPR